MDVGEGQKRTRCIDSPVRRRGGVKCSENGVVLHGNQPLLHIESNGPFRPTTAFQMPSVGVPASPWMWAKARSQRGALIRLCGDGVVSNVARNGFILHGNQPLLLLHTETNGPFRPTTAFQMPSVGVPASPWMWAKARSERGALIRLCGDGVVSNVARNGSFILHGNQPLLLHTETKRTVPTHHRVPDALRWCSRLALDVGEGQKRTRWIDSPVRRRGGVECSEKRVIILHGNQPLLLHTETDRSDPPPRSRCPPLVFPPRHGCGRRPEANEVH
jgi:hypothetical protein